jgi:hypothetical protein
MKRHDIIEVSCRHVVIRFYKRLKGFLKFAVQLFIVYILAGAESRQRRVCESRCLSCVASEGLICQIKVAIPAFHTLGIFHHNTILSCKI